MTKVLFFLLFLPLLGLGGPPCPPPPSYPGGELVCFPEVPPDSWVPDGTDCILTCGASSSSGHSCQGGSWDLDPSLLRCITPGCPPIFGTDPTGEFACFPSLPPNTTALPGTFCIYSCGGHPVDEITCQQGGYWTSDPEHLSCASTVPTTTLKPITTSVTTTTPATTSAPPNLSAELMWAFYYLGTGIGVTGILVGDFDGNGRIEFILGSGSGFGKNTEISTLEFVEDVYEVVWQDRLSSGNYDDPSISDISLVNVNGTNYMAVSVSMDRSATVHIYDLKTREKIKVLEKSYAIVETITADLNKDGNIEVMFLSKDSNSRNSFTLTLLDLQDDWNDAFNYHFESENSWFSIVFGSFTNASTTQIALTNGEVYDIDISGSLVKVADFNMDLGRYLFKYDIDGDGIDEIICSKNGISAYSAIDLGRVWNSNLDHAVDAMVINDLDGDGRDDIVWGGDQWGDIAALDIVTGEEFWRIDNPKHGVSGIAVGDFDQDGDIEIAWGAGYSSTGEDYFFIVDVETKEEEWSSLAIDPPFRGFDIHDPAGDGELQITALSQGIIFGFNFHTKKLLWKIETSKFGKSWDLTTGDLTNDGVREVIAVEDNTIRIIDGITGGLEYDVKLGYGSDIKSIMTADIYSDTQSRVMAVGDSSSNLILLSADGSPIKNSSNVGSGVISALSAWRQCSDTNVVSILALSTSYSKSQLFAYNLDNGHLYKVWEEDFITAMAPYFGGLNSDKLYLGTKDGRLLATDCRIDPLSALQLCEGPVLSLSVLSAVEVAYVCETGEWGVVNVLEERKEMVEVDKDVTKVATYNIEDEVFFLAGGRVLKLYRAVELLRSN